MAVAVFVLFSVTAFASGLKGLDQSKFRWAETYLMQYQQTSGSSKDISRTKVETYVAEIQAELDQNRYDPEYTKYKARLDRLIAGLNEDINETGVPKDIGEAKSNIYWAKGKIEYALKDPEHAGSLDSAQNNLGIAEKILYSGGYQAAAGEYKELLDLYKKLRRDLDKLQASK